MQAVILAGGLGTRLLPLTETVSKPMAPVAGVPYLYHQLSFLRAQGVTEILLLTGYLGEQIEEYFGDGSAFGLSIVYSREHRPLGTGGALRYAAGKLADKFLLLYGDSYLPISYRHLFADLERTGATAVLTVYDNSLGNSTVQNNIALDTECRVTCYEKNSSRAGLHYVDAGVLAMRCSVLDYLPAVEPVSLEQEAFPKMITDRKLFAHVSANRFYDIGTPDRLRAFEEFIANDHHSYAV